MKTPKLKKCWKCKDEYRQPDFNTNGLCLDCYEDCRRASEVHDQMMNEFEDGELSDSAFRKEYQRRLSCGY